MFHSPDLSPVESGCLDAPMLLPAGSTVQYEVREDCTDENGNDTGYFRVIGYEADPSVTTRYGFWISW